MNEHITIPDFRLGKVSFIPWTPNEFDHVIADWTNQERKDRERKRKAGWAVVGEILKQRQVMLGQIDPAIKLAETNRRSKQRGQTSLL